MDGTTFADSFIGKKYAGAIFLYFKGIFTFKIPFPNLSVADLQMAGYPVYILCRNVKG